jgi:hypothetical protein
MTRIRLTAAALAISVLVTAIGFSGCAEAKITKLEIDTKQSYGTFRAGEFVRWDGRVVGELRPTEKIPDIDKAPRNADGLVEYSAKISLIFPGNPKAGNGTLLVDIPNRGRPYAQGLYNSPRDEPFEAGTFEVGPDSCRTTGFRSPRCNGNWGRAPNYPLSPTAPDKSVLSRAWVLPLSATPLIFSAMRPPTPQARPIRCKARSSGCWLPASRNRGAISRRSC